MTSNPHVASLDAGLSRAVRHASIVRQAFYAVVLLVALTGQVMGAHQALDIPIVVALPAVAALELGGIVVLSNADVRRRLGERSTLSRLLSAGIAAGAVAFNLLTHSDRLLAGFFAGMSLLGYLVWLMHTENQRRDRLRATGNLPPTTPAYEVFGHWLRHPLLTLRAKSLAKTDANLGLYGSIEAARYEVRRERRRTAIAKVLHRKIRAVVDPLTADIATATYDLDEVATRLAATADYDNLTTLIGTDLHPTRLVNTDADLIAQIEQARDGETRAIAAVQEANTAADAATARARDAETHAARMADEVATTVDALNAQYEMRAAVEARANDLAGQLADAIQARQAAEDAAARAVEATAAQTSETDALRARLAELEAQTARLTKQIPARPAAPVKANRPATKRQPSNAERVAKAIARSPKASDATIAARLDLSEATVKRHRRQAVDSVSTPTTLHAA
ncbi:hypothetical protein [Phytohabitans aurantiacus]|uniref:Uncharacterized protein n=1 Tax=Phytohabitans aurantiacus TaxID=3016789 RepID=A0ABQ5QTU4_9ACTN|nr:hypothetical protein [Phytohabitans aurantiacus]GLH97139.1 hypothetical protein Pa4123_24140 [Phytohabitans aurantiacus]